jgi:hypothetical protein
MPQRKSLGVNIGRPGAMLAALGLAAPTDGLAAPTDAEPASPVAEESPPATPRLPTGPRVPGPSPLAVRELPPRSEAATTVAPGRLARIATDISAETLDLAKRAAYWNRQTLRDFLEDAIRSQARRIAEGQQSGELPPIPGLRRGRPLRD